MWHDDIEIAMNLWWDTKSCSGTSLSRSTCVLPSSSIMPHYYCFHWLSTLHTRKQQKTHHNSCILSYLTSNRGLGFRMLMNNWDQSALWTYIHTQNQQLQPFCCMIYLHIQGHHCISVADCAWTTSITCICKHKLKHINFMHTVSMM
jgi:hypothetical protein